MTRPPLWTDTSPDAERVLLEGYRRMTVQDKARRVTTLVQSGYQMVWARVRAEHPEEDDDTVMIRVASLFLEPELLAAALRHRERAR